MAEIYGRKDGLCKGIGGSMHLTDVSQRLPRHVGHRRGRHPARRRRRLGGADPQAGPGRPLLLRRRRLQAGRVRRDAQHRLAVEAPDRLRDGEQRLQRPHAHRAGGRQPRQRRGSLRQGQGLQHARRDDRRPRPGRRLRDGRRRRRACARGRRARRSSSRRCTASRRTATSSPRPACRCTSPSTRRSRSSARPRSTRRPSRATRCRPSAGGSSPTARSRPPRPTRSAAKVRDEMQAAVTFGLESPFPDTSEALAYNEA